MDQIKKKIEEILKGKEFIDITSKTRNEIIEKLFVYHEELIFQNQELKKSNDQVNYLKDKYKSLFENAPVIYLYIDSLEQIVDFNEKAKDFFKSIKKNKKFYKLIHPDSQDDYYYHMRKLKKKNGSVSSYLKSKLNGDVKYFKIVSQPVILEGKQYYQCTLIDQTNEQKAKKKITALGYKDSLTGLYNRRYFDKSIKKLDKVKNLPLGIIIADINGLKLINDTFGHQIGDELLVKTSEILRNNFRNEDIIARLGGDEFAVIIPKINKKALSKIVKRVKKEFSEIHLKDLIFSVAIGTSIKFDKDQSIKKLFKKAEEIMYQKKLLMRSNYHQNAIKGIITTLHEKHPREEKHSNRVQRYMARFANLNRYNFDKSILETVGLLHDIGKVAIDYSILEKPRKLNKKEFEEVKKHPEVGYRILKSAGLSKKIIDAVLYHHERYDGSGYPKGLKGNEIPLLARILTVCDAYDAMTTERPYQNAFSVKKATKELIENKKNQFDPLIVDIFIEKII
ncbi:MAG: diguanylate cyclase [Bacillota bacterium]